MLAFKPLLLAILFATAGPAAQAHTLLTNLFVNGEDQGAGTCLRMPSHPNNATFPQPSVTASSMACGFNGETAVNRTCAVPEGSTISLQWRDYPDGSKAGSIDPSHKGPCAVYMKKVDDATVNGTAAGDGWFRIFYSDYDESASRWCTEQLIADNGLLTLQMPSGLAAGDYLLRSELLALHSADATPPDPQFYISCAQIFLQPASNSSSSSSSASDSTDTVIPPPSNTVAIPGYVNLSLPAMTFNIWKTPMALPYPGYGPTVFKGDQGGPTARRRDNVATQPPKGSSKSGNFHRSSSNHKRASAVVQTTGLKPAGCILAVSNWCGVEVPSYNNQSGCWNASKACYTQESACYSFAGPTGGADCKIWDAKCKGIQQDCAAGNYQGPPDAGKVLTPPVENVDVPDVYKMFGPAGIVGGGSGDDAGASVITNAIGTTSIFQQQPSQSPTSTGDVSSDSNSNTNSNANADANDSNSNNDSPSVVIVTATTFITVVEIFSPAAQVSPVVAAAATLTDAVDSTSTFVMSSSPTVL